MRVEKDVILAVVIGILIGGVAASAVFFLPKYLKPKLPEKMIKKETPQPSPTILVTPSPAFSLNLTSPLDESVFSENKILVSGKTQPGAMVLITSPVDEMAIEANGEGKFESNILLEEGANEVSVTAYKDSQEETKSITVYYTEEETE